MRVLHDYLGEIIEVAADQRERFWDDAESRTLTSAYSRFCGAEFKER